MGRETLGDVKGGKTRNWFTVGYDPQTKWVCVDVGGLFGRNWVNAGTQAACAQCAMPEAEVWAYNR